MSRAPFSRWVIARHSVALLLCAATLSGCTFSAERWLALDRLPPAPEVHAQLVQRSPYGIAPDEDVLALTPAIRVFLDEKLRRFGPRERLRRLGDLFTRAGELELTYDQEVTRPASDVFVTRRGNCLSFTQLFIAMAREVGIHARFQEARSAASWTRLGDVLLINRHITAWGFVTGATYEADFGDFDLDTTSLRQIVSDERARAQYFNNLGAESVARGAPASAIPLFNRALSIDPDLAYVWTNLGTALKQVKRDVDAELAFRHALRLDSNSLPALNGIARIEEARGNTRAADALRRLADRLNARNPYVHFATAQAAIARGDYPQAVSALHTAIRLNAAEPDFRFELGRAYIAMGKLPNAMVEFEVLTTLIKDADQERIYAERLRQIVAALPQRPATATDNARPVEPAATPQQ